MDESIKTQPFRFPTSSLLVLKKKFESSPYPTKDEYEELSRYLNTSKKRILQWFSDKRKIMKKKGIHFRHQKQCSNDTGQQLGQKQVSHTNSTIQLFSEQQRSILKEAFEATGGRLPDKIQMKSLTDRLKVNNVQIIEWWLKRERARLRKQETLEGSSQSKQSH